MFGRFRRSRTSVPRSSATLPPRSSIPKASIVALQGVSDGFPEWRFVNQALDALRVTGDFPWHLSLILEMAETIPVGLPTKAESAFLRTFADELAMRLEANENGVHLASITWNGTRQYVFRLRDPKPAHAYLSALAAEPSAPRPFEYRIEQDPTWRFAEQYLRPGREAVAPPRT